MRILDIALKDLSQIIRDRKSLIFLALMPIVFTAFMGFAYRSAAEGERDDRLPVGLADSDPQGALSQAFKDLLAASGAVRLVELKAGTTDQAAEQVRKGELVAAILIPPDFTRRILSEEADRQPDPQSLLTVILDETAPAGQAARQVVQTAFLRLMHSAESAHLAVEQIDAQQPFASQAQRQAALDEAVAQARQAWQKPALTVEVQKAVSQEQAARPFGGNPYNQASPGMIVQFAVFGLVASSMALLLERKSRTLQRMLTTSASRAEIILGHLLTIFATVFVQQLLLVVFAQLALGVDYLRQPLSTLLMMGAVSLWIASLGMLIGVIAKEENQVILFSLIAMFVFTALAGAWFPLEGTGPAFNALGHLTPGAFAMDGYQNIVMRGLGLSSVLFPAAALTGYALLFFGLALWRFRFE